MRSRGIILAPQCGLLAFELVHHGAFEFAVGVAAFEVFPFVVLDLSFAHSQFDFDLAVLPEEGEGEDGVALDVTESEEFADFGFVEEQLAPGFGIVVDPVAKGVFLDMGVVEPHFHVFDTCERVPDDAFAVSKGFDFRAMQHDPGFEQLYDMVIPARLGITGDFVGVVFLGHG